MAHYSFEWNADKARSNEQKHGVGFEEAKTCFLDLFAIESLDVHHSNGETRFVMIGMSELQRLLVVAYTLPDHKTIRIISARKALRRERLRYEEKAGR